MNAITRMQPETAATPSHGVPFDALLEMARRGAVTEALDQLTAALAQARMRASPEMWTRVVSEARTHALREFVHRDPFTLRCYAKPRGYPGDAIALDYVLCGPELPARSSDPVAALHHYTTHGQTARALQFRRDYLAREIDAAADRSPRPIDVFAAGCGHLRECDRIRAFALGKIRKLVAFDTDAGNLECVPRDYPHLPIALYPGSVRQLADGKHLYSEMDLVYCAGIMETLPQPSARGLARALFAMLKPGGTLVITNFLRSHAEAGYLEAYMDWRMAYRMQSEFHDFVGVLDPDALASSRYCENPEATLGVITVTRR
jgi:hypothetical protein